MKGIITAAAILATLVYVPLAYGAPATAGQICGSRPAVLATLAQDFHEYPIAVAEGGRDGAVLEITASARGATWSLLVVLADGSACVMLSGKNWKFRRPPIDRGKPA